jgi:hypothetical protein
MQHEWMMDHAYVFLTGRELLIALSIVVNAIIDAHLSEVELSVQDLKHQTVNLVTVMLIVMSTENVSVTRAGEDSTVISGKENVILDAQPAMDQKLMIVVIVCQTLPIRMEHVTVMTVMEVSTVLIIRESVTLCVAAVPDQPKQTVHLVSQMLAVMLMDIVSVTPAGQATTVMPSKVLAGMSVPFSEEMMTAQRDQSSVNDV